MFVDLVAGFDEGGGLKAKGAAGEPLMLGDFEHQRFFRYRLGRVFVPERGKKFLELVLVFIFEDTEGTGEAVDEVVQARCCAAFRVAGPVLSWAFARLACSRAGLFGFLWLIPRRRVAWRGTRRSRPETWEVPLRRSF